MSTPWGAVVSAEARVRVELIDSAAAALVARALSLLRWGPIYRAQLSERYRRKYALQDDTPALHLGPNMDRRNTLSD